jgi:hypothetical protein
MPMPMPMSFGAWANGPFSRRLELLLDATRGVDAGHMGCSEDCLKRNRLSFIQFWDRP